MTLIRRWGDQRDSQRTYRRDGGTSIARRSAFRTIPVWCRRRDSSLERHGERMAPCESASRIYGSSRASPVVKKAAPGCGGYAVTGFPSSLDPRLDGRARFIRRMLTDGRALSGDPRKRVSPSVQARFVLTPGRCWKERRARRWKMCFLLPVRSPRPRGPDAGR